MPQISRFFGIVVVMYYNDHDPPHFHVRYNEQKARFAVSDLHMIDGVISSRVRGLVVEWASQHQSELHEDWRLAQARQPLLKIEPLK